MSIVGDPNVSAVNSLVVVHLVFGISFGDIGVGDGVFICMGMSPPQGEVFIFLSIYLVSARRESHNCILNY